MQSDRDSARIRPKRPSYAPGNRRSPSNCARVCLIATAAGLSLTLLGCDKKKSAFDALTSELPTGCAVDAERSNSVTLYVDCREGMSEVEQTASGIARAATVRSESVGRSLKAVCPKLRDAKFNQVHVTTKIGDGGELVTHWNAKTDNCDVVGDHEHCLASVTIGEEGCDLLNLSGGPSLPARSPSPLDPAQPIVPE